MTNYVTGISELEDAYLDDIYIIVYYCVIFIYILYNMASIIYLHILLFPN